MKCSLINMLPFLLAADLLIPFLLGPTYKGYNHFTQVMSVLGNPKAPLHLLYRTWLVVLGTAIFISTLHLYPSIAKVSGPIAAALSFVLIIYAVGGCILSGIFPVGETKNLETMSAKIHGYGSAIGFLFLTFAPLLIGLYFFKISNGLWGALSLICFVLAFIFFTLFVMADKPVNQGSVVALGGLWQRLALVSMYVPVVGVLF